VNAPANKLSRGKRRTVLSVLMMLTGMTLLVVYAVPLYEMFCRVTGYGGTTQRAGKAPGAMGERSFTIRFDAETNPQLPWGFRPAQRQVTVRAGERKLIFYVAKNNSDEAITGTATFNVTPAKAGRYFNKIQCFCFSKQLLKPGQRMDMPVSFFVDPAILKARNLRDVSVITLSYTFFRARKQAKRPVRGNGNTTSNISSKKGG
jgi:cytochrome c oxidase assembly protein subunit 11